MNGLAEYGVLAPHEEKGLKVAIERPRSAAREDHQTRPYVVGALSWDPARFLDAEALPAGAFDAPEGENENTLQPEWGSSHDRVHEHRRAGRLRLPPRPPQ